MLLNKYISRCPTFLSTLRQFNIAMEHGPFICIYIYDYMCIFSLDLPSKNGGCPVRYLNFTKGY